MIKNLHLEFNNLTKVLFIKEITKIINSMEKD